MMVCWESKVTMLTPAEAGPVTAKLLNVFALVTLRVPVPVPAKVKLLYVNPAPANVFDPFTTIVDVPAFNVKPVLVTFHGAPEIPEPTLIVDAPNTSARVSAPVELKEPGVVMLNPAVFSVPCVTAIGVEAAPPTVRALPSVHPPPAPLKVTAPPENAPVRTVPLVVIVLPVVVELNVMGPVLLHTVPVTNDMEPRISIDGVVPVANVTVPADTVMSRQVKPPVIVTV